MREQAKVRAAAVAGTFYPGDRKGLESMLNECFQGRMGPGRLPVPVESAAGGCVGLISPHAGYIYSGGCAAFGFERVAGLGTFDLAVVIGPNHRSWGAEVAVYPEGSFATPLGEMEIAKEVCADLVAARAASPDERAHAMEHSVEVQLPFIQYVWREHVPKLVPIVMADQGEAVSVGLGEALSGATAGRSVLIVASTDFTHYRPRGVAERQDKYALDRILALDASGLLREVRNRGISMCGYGPTAAMLTACKAMGCSKAELLRYCTSGDVTSDNSDVVAYASILVQ